jgi:hypothetical protein
MYPFTNTGFIHKTLFKISFVTPTVFLSLFYPRRNKRADVFKNKQILINLPTQIVLILHGSACCINAQFREHPLSKLCFAQSTLLRFSLQQKVFSCPRKPPQR